VVVKVGVWLAATAMTVGLLPVVGAAAATAQESVGVDPALVAQVEAAWLSGMRDAWGRDGGTYDQRCTRPGSEAPSTHTHLALDVRKRRWVERADVGYGALPAETTVIGKNEYRRTVKEIRQALRVHGVGAVAWTSRGISAHRAERGYFHVTHRNRGRSHPAWFEWLDLTVTSDAAGNRTYTGRYRMDAGSVGDTKYYYTPEVEIRVDAQGRPTYWYASGVYQGIPGVEPTTVLTCTETWDWRRPRIGAPVTRNALRHVVDVEIDGRRGAEGMADAANSRARGATVRWLQHRFGGAQYRTSPIEHGVRQHWQAAGYQLDWKVVVRHGTARYRPVAR
jgi:hypothetical protein